MRLTSGAYPGQYSPTVFDNHCSVCVDQGPILPGWWDTAGGEEYTRLRVLSYPKAEVAFVCFDLCAEVAAEDAGEQLVARWVREVRQVVPAVRIVLVGTKSDQRLGLNVPSSVRAEQLRNPTCVLRPFAWGMLMAHEVDAYAYLETSAITGCCVDQLKPMLVEALDATRAENEETKKCTLM